MNTIQADPDLVAYCGLYCGACRSYLKEKCPGCHENSKAGWCKVRTCCLENSYTSCADCGEFADPMACLRFNNFLSRLVGFVLRSDRSACIRQIKEIGVEGHAEQMASARSQTIRKGASKTRA